MVKKIFLAHNSAVLEQDHETIQIMKTFWKVSRARLRKITLKTDLISF